MTSEIAKLFVTLGLDSSEFQSKLKGVESTLKNTGKVMTGIGAGITAALGLSIKTFAETGDAIQKLAIKTGFSTEALSELKYAAELSGASLDTIEVSAKKMQQAIVDAGAGSKTATDAFKALGLSVTDLQKLTPEQQFLKISEALANVDDQALKTSLAVDIFGKSGTDLLPMLAEGADGLQKMRDEAKDLGLVFDQNAANSAAAFSDSLEKLKGGMQGIMNTIGQNLVPVLIPLIEKIQSVIKGIADWAKEHPGLTRMILIIVLAIGGLFVVLGPILMMLPALAAGFNMLLGPVGLVIIAIMVLVAVATLIISNWSKIKDFFENLWNNIIGFLKGVWDTIVGFVKENWDKILAILFPAIGLPILIARHWGEIVDKVKEIWNNVVDWFRGIPEKIGTIFATVKDFILAPFRAAWQGIEAGLNWLIRMMNKISFTIPDWVPGIGGKSFGFNIPEVTLPSFDTGGILQGPGLFQVGAGIKEIIRYPSPFQPGEVQGATINEINIYASTKEGGQAAARGFLDEMHRRGIKLSGAF